MPTQVDEEKLEHWKSRLPKRLHIFFENFFGTCRGLDPEPNYFNYLTDIELYGLITNAYREHTAELQEAFYEITGWRPGSA